MARKTATKTKTIIRGVDVPYANQYLPDPRQKLCWDLYINPKSETFGNATQSALKVGFSEGHAAQITTQDWWLVKARRLGLLSKAERNLDEMLELPSVTQAMSMFGPIFEKKEIKVKLKNGKTKIKKINGAPVMKHNPELLKVKLDASKFVAERIGKTLYGKGEDDGGDVFNIIIFGNEQLKRIAARTLGGRIDGSPESA